MATSSKQKGGTVYYCRYSQKYCEWWHNSDYYLQIHYDMCNHQYVRCCFCGEMMAKGRLVYVHLTEECQHRMLDSVKHDGPFMCPLSHTGCTWVGSTKEKWETHRTLRCNFLEVTCLCGKLVLKGRLHEHMQTEDCKYYMKRLDGCEYKTDPSRCNKVTENGPEPYPKGQLIMQTVEKDMMINMMACGIEKMEVDA